MQTDHMAKPRSAYNRAVSTLCNVLCVIVLGLWVTLRTVLAQVSLASMLATTAPLAQAARQTLTMLSHRMPMHLTKQISDSSSSSNRSKFGGEQYL